MSKYLTFSEWNIGKSNVARVNIKKISAVVENDRGSTIYLDGGQTLSVRESLPDIMEKLEKHEGGDTNGVSRYRTT